MRWSPTEGGHIPYKRPGSRYWQITVDGLRKSAGTDKFEAAKALENKLNHEAWLTQKMGLKLPRSCQEAVVRFVKDNAHQARSRDTTQPLRWFDPWFRDVEDIRLITREWLDEILTTRGATSNPCSTNSTANSYMVAVSALIGAACQKHDWIERKPIFRTYPEPQSNGRALSIEEWRALEAELPVHLRRPAKFALGTGLRDEKVFRLKWSQVDMQNRSLTKRGTARQTANQLRRCVAQGSHKGLHNGL